MIEFDPLRIVETLTVIGAASAVVYKLGRSVAKFESIGKEQAIEIKQQAETIRRIEQTLAEISGVVTTMAVEKVRLDTHAQRLTQIEQLVDDLRRGEGMILPLDVAMRHRLEGKEKK